MEIVSKTEGSKVTMEIIGWLDTQTGPQLEKELAALDPGTAEKVLNLTRRIVEEHQLTCLMITHNMQSSIDIGNRILMMDSGNIVLDIEGEEKKNMTVEGLLEKFRSGAGKALDNYRILLSD